MRLFERQRSQKRFAPPTLTPCRTALESAAAPQSFDPSFIWTLRLDPLSKLLLLAYADLADATGRVLQPDVHALAAQTGMLTASVKERTRALLEKRLLTMLVVEPEDDAWGFRVTVAGRAEA